MRKRILEGWKPEAELGPVRLATLLLVGVGSAVLAIVCFRVAGELGGLGSTLMWVGLCICPPIGVGAWFIDQQRRSKAGLRARSKDDGEDSSQDFCSEGDTEQACETLLKINRDVA